jgi:hypothetical protein
MFGGQKASGGYGSNTGQRDLLNDILIYDISQMKVIDQTEFSEANLGRRMYHSGFKIDDSIFSIGGQGKDGKIYDQFVEIDIGKMKQ